MIWAFHDVNPNTDAWELLSIARTIERRFPDAEILCAITLFAGEADHGGLYQEMPIGGKPWADILSVSSERPFDGISKFFRMVVMPQLKVVSHGLVHVQHSQLNIDAQRMSIVTSCRYLGTDTFIPPFDSYSDATLKVCEEHGITLEPVRAHGWKCLERHPFDPCHLRWHLHPWKWTAEKFEETINAA